MAASATHAALTMDWSNMSHGGAAEGWNASQLEGGLEGIAKLALDPSFALLLTALSAAAAWAVSALFYRSRLLATLLTRAANRLYFPHHNFRIGSVTFSALAGKLMFRDLVYVGYDYSLRVQDGYVIFRWWRAYVPKDVSEDLSHGDTRLSLVLNGLELHVYNRCGLYAQLEAAFGLEPRIGAATDETDAAAEKGKARVVGGEAALARTWRDLVPVIKVDVSMARVVFGNKLVPSALALSAEEARLTYSTKPAASALDLRMHFVKGAADNVKMLLAPSPGYTALHDEPPRYMGEGFVVMSSSRVELYAYADEPGAVPPQPVLLRLANGDVAESAPPVLGLDLKVGKGTDFSYGPWADRQRDHLHRLFFPPSHEPLRPTPPPVPGQRRAPHAFDFRLSTLNEATVDVLFSKQQETSAVHVNVGAGSYLEVTVPWVVGAEGYTLRVQGQLLHVDASSSLPSRPLVECETLEWAARAHYPLHYTHAQRWALALTGCKATVHLLYAHIPFFADLVTDWGARDAPDLLRFVPYTWSVSLVLKEFELILLANEHNWVDCGSTNQENAHVAVCGDLLDLAVELPFEDFLPRTSGVTVWAQGEGVAAALSLPDTSAARPTLLALERLARLAWRAPKAARWRRRAHAWIDCWHVPLVALSVAYSWHGAAPQGPEPQADITTPEKEELLLSPMRFGRAPHPAPRARPPVPPPERAQLAPDTVTLELEVGPSEMVAYGTLLQLLAHLLDNIFGDDQAFTDMARGGGEPSPSGAGDEAQGVARPLEVAVAVTLHDVRAHLPRPCSDAEPPCPVVLVERIAFEMDKSFDQTVLQLVLSPALLLPGGEAGGGHAALAALQLRGHGMHSDAGRAPHQDTVEYAWLLELTLGRLTAQLSVPHLYHVGGALETFALLLDAHEDELRAPRGPRPCHHGRAPATCPHAAACPPSLSVRYRMLRLAVEPAELWLTDATSALRVRPAGLRASWCNLPGPGCSSAASALVPGLRAALLVQPAGAGDWLRAGALTLGPLALELALVPAAPELGALQLQFLRLHDQRSRRLWFLWGDARCGCLGGCAFVGSNRGGATLFRPSASEAASGVNVCAYRVLAAPERGFGQSLLHAGALVFRTPPYSAGVQPPPPSPPPAPASAPAARRSEQVPYARLLDVGRMDSDSRLHRAGAALDAPLMESSASDSRLAGGGARLRPVSRSRHSLHGPPPAPRRAPSVSSEPPSEAFVSADEEHPATAAQAVGDSASLSSASFVSAVSSQEDVAMVHLRAQASRPIADSPLLLAGYARCLPRYRRLERPVSAAAGPGQPPPLVERGAGDGPLLYVAHRLLPRYEPAGGALYRLADRNDAHSTGSGGGDGAPALRAHPPPPAWWDAFEPSDGDGSASWDEDLGVSVRVRGDVELTLTPLVLECAQRACEALTPLLAGAHPAAVLDALRLRCVAAVRRASPLHARLDALGTEVESLEREISSRVRWALGVGRVQLLVLQAGAAEEVTSFAALDEPLELAGVSLLGVRGGGLRARGSSCRRALHALRRRPPPRAARRPAASILKSARAAPPAAADSPALYTETSQPTQGDLTVTVDLESVQAQLRRVRTESGPQGGGGVGGAGGTEPLLTAIAPPHARACFTVLHNGGESGEGAAGYVMAECGLEGGVLQGARRLPATDAPDTAPPRAQSTNQSAAEPPPAEETGREATSGRLEAALVWFNFAAPPRSAGVAGRRDWNLLSTASPAINAWLNPANRLGIRAVGAHRAKARRYAATVAGLMAGALESPVPPPSTRNRVHSAAARRLRQEPALRLLGALARHLLAADGAALAADLAARHVPALLVLRRALLVLARQWSALLAAPLLPDCPPPLSVAFAPDLPAPDDWPTESSHLLHHAHAPTTHDESANDSGAGSDLYSWMAAQEAVPWRPPRIPPPPPLHPPRAHAACLRPVRGAPLLLDAHAAFAPLLLELGVRCTPHAAQARCSLRCGVTALRVHLAGAEAPALVLQRLSVSGGARQVADAAVEQLVRRQDVLYISRDQLRRHFSTMLNIELSVHFISQQVTMPLLRLLHQISSMYSSVREAQGELRTQRATGQPDGNSDASECRDTLVSDSSLERDTQYSTLDRSTAGWEAPARPARPPSLAARLRNTGRSVRGRLGISTHSGSNNDAYSTLNEDARTPPPQLAPRCWRTVHLLLELYANMADADSVTHHFSVRADQELGAPSPAVAGAARAPQPGLVLVGSARVQRVRLLATLSGLQLEAELCGLQAAPSATLGRQWALSLTLGGAAGALLEGGASAPVVRASLGKSQALVSRAHSKAAQVLVALGAVRADLPQHPVALHGVVTRSSRQLSSTLQELGVRRAEPSPPPSAAGAAAGAGGGVLPLVRFQLGVASVALSAALLPSLQAQYRMLGVSAAGETGPEAHFTVELPQHSLGFAARRGAAHEAGGLPAAALVALPAVHAQGRVRDEVAEGAADGARLKPGRYLHATADVGLFEHTLSTDLLNHLVFVQKVFMREVNEVVQKVWGGRVGGGRGAAGGGGSGAGGGGGLLLALVVRVARVALTATTPSSCAVRLEASALTLELSNRVANAPAGGAGPLFARAQLDLNLSLGQLIRNAMFEEAEPEFQQYAFFKTRISLRNAYAEEMASEGPVGAGAGAVAREVAVLCVRRPLVYVQPVAVDKAVLVYLSYKAAYDYWTEARRALAAEVRHATQQLLEAVQQATAAPAAALLLRLDVDDVGICLPLGAPGQPAVLVTLDATSVSACSGAALACRGRFVGLCLRFALDFEPSLDDWKPRADEPALNVCRVSEGTYDVCSRTEAAKANENAKWFLNVSWQMEGVDIHLDTSVGGLLSALGQTLTALTGDEEAGEGAAGGEGAGGERPDSAPVTAHRRDLPAQLLDATLDARARSKLLEHEMSEQAKIINDLRALGASHATVETELRRLQELEALAFKDFRRDMLQRLRRPSARASAPPSAAPAYHDHDQAQRLAHIAEGTNWSSVDGELTAPASAPGPARTASLRARGVAGGPGGVQRQSSLPAGAEPWGAPLQAVELREPPPPEPNIDLELDVRVHISSGQCVLHTKSEGAGGGGGSPTLRRRGARDTTTFLVPGLALAVHYDSRTEPQRPAAAKRAALYAWITLQRIPEETLVSPHILDFLEQALEPLGPAGRHERPPTLAAPAPAAAADGLAYASFPVEVVVHVHLQPSSFRFSCLPASRVECLLGLPALRLVFSSRAQDAGLSVTGCLDDFRVHVFHPYGGAQQRKDSLSVHVEFVKFHLARSRRMHKHSNTVRFSTIVDVGAACFKYDMRRLGEILAFPRAWYRRAIVRRLFLGDPGAAPAPAPAPAAPPPPKASWETLVLFAVNFTKLTVHMNMGNVMGNVGWQSGELTANGRLSIGSSGHRNLLLTVALASSALDARAGIVGGALSLSDIHTYVHVVSGAEGAGAPMHAAGLRLAALELRGEYMGSTALMARASRLRARLRDQWGPAVLVHAALHWHQLQLLMSRSTTPDLLKMQLKLEEFFTQQFKSGRRVISALHPELKARKTAPQPPGATNSTPGPDDWRRARRLLYRRAPAAAVLGGTMELHGAHVSLACFHGASFKAKSWALFSLKDPCVSFTTEVQHTDDDECRRMVQSLTATLGGGATVGAGHVSVGVVCRMTRALLFPPQLKTLHDWFAYATAGSDIDAIATFPCLEPASPARPPDRHVREVIFALPPLQLHLRTQHAPGPDDKPLVECSFITEFEDHIFVSVDAEAFLFLHDLIASYLQGQGAKTPPPGAPAPQPSDPRSYRCVTWHLEPTVRLLAWAGKSIEPYGVDYILQKLGFSHARTTIPKWLQRGALDPLDRVLAHALRRLLAALPPAPTPSSPPPQHHTKS